MMEHVLITPILANFIQKRDFVLFPHFQPGPHTFFNKGGFKMMVTKKLILPVIFVLAFIATQAGASEWFSDVTLGIGFTDAENGGIRQNAAVTLRELVI